MKRVEIAFLVCVLGFAFVFACRSFSQTLAVFQARAAARATPGAAGKSRHIDVHQFERLLRQKSLSEHEALFYKSLK